MMDRIFNALDETINKSSIDDLRNFLCKFKNVNKNTHCSGRVFHIIPLNRQLCVS